MGLSVEAPWQRVALVLMVLGASNRAENARRLARQVTRWYRNARRGRGPKSRKPTQLRLP
jgi:hypothetical protein